MTYLLFIPIITCILIALLIYIEIENEKKDK